ncbi:LptA/OstA family protein, partial [Paracoccus sp. (in: a-proteobacteria)]
SGEDAAEAAEAVYDVAAGSVLLTGDVLLTQGSNVLAGERMTVDLATGAAQVQGRVRSVLQPGSN